MPEDGSSSFHKIPILNQCSNSECVMGDVIMEIRDNVNYIMQEQKHIKRDVSELRDDRRNIVLGILTFVGITVGGVVIWALKHGA